MLNIVMGFFRCSVGERFMATSDDVTVHRSIMQHCGDRGSQGKAAEQGGDILAAAQLRRPFDAHPHNRAILV